MPPLHHYVIVRRDLSFGAILASVLHAAGESFYAFAKRDDLDQAMRERGERPEDTVGVVLGARNESRLQKLEDRLRSEEHTSELQSHSFISYAVFCLKK